MSKRKVIDLEGKKLYVEFSLGRVFIRKPIYEKILFWKMEIHPEIVGLGKTLDEAIADFKSGRIEKADKEAERLGKVFEKDIIKSSLLEPSGNGDK